MSAAAVVFDRVWKKFRRGQRHDSLRDLLPALARRVVGGRRPDELEGEEEFWALKDVSLEIRRGEALGVIGPNGAGKSTMLKLLTRLLKPTRGTCRVSGRVGALIEVAAGFHPDLTGRENVFLQGAIMGMKRAEISRTMDNIVDFSGIAPFIDTPVKRYSSGMQARLGFAIAAHLNPDVLFIDEVLSVGDMEFQQRCVNRMLEFKRAGVTIVFVSHDLNAVARLCDRALLLRGAVVAIGDTADILETHVRASMQGGAASSPEISISRVVLSDEAGSATAVARPGDALHVSVAYQIHAEMSDLQFGFVVHRSTDDMVVYDESVTQQALGLSRLASGTTLMLDFAFTANLTRGHYYIELHTYRATTARFPIRLRPAVTFEVKESRSYAGVAHLDLEVRPSTVREPAVAAARGVSAAREAEKLSVS